MPVPLSRLKDTIKEAAKAVTNGAEELFTDGLRFGRIEGGIQFTIQVYDDRLDPQLMSRTVEDSPEIVTEQTGTELAGTTRQEQAYGRSSRSETTYEG